MDILTRSSPHHLKLGYLSEKTMALVWLANILKKKIFADKSTNFWWTPLVLTR